MKILVVTGKFAEPIVKNAVKELVSKYGSKLNLDILVIDVPIAALITPNKLLDEFKKQLSFIKQFDVILVPGLMRGDVSNIAKDLNIKIFKGTKYIGDIEIAIKALLSGKELSTEIAADDYLHKELQITINKLLKNLEEKAEVAFNIGKLSIPIRGPPIRLFAEIPPEVLVNETKVMKLAKKFIQCGADLIIIGTSVNSNIPDKVGYIIKKLISSLDVPVGIDSLNTEEVKAAISSGAKLVMNLSRSFLEIYEDFASDVAFVLVPEGSKASSAEGRFEELSEVSKRAKAMGYRKLILNPVISPPLLGMIEGLVALRFISKYIKEYPVLIEVSNITELIDADDHGIHAILASIAMEVGASAILITESSWKTRGSVFEMKQALYMNYIAKIKHSPPIDITPNLLLIKERRPKKWHIPIAHEIIRVSGSSNVQTKPRSEDTVVIGINKERNEIIATILERGRPKVSIISKSALDTGRTIISKIKEIDPYHALYLGYELCKAEIANKIGRSYIQDEDVFSLSDEFSLCVDC